MLEKIKSSNVIQRDIVHVYVRQLVGERREKNSNYAPERLFDRIRNDKNAREVSRKKGPR